MFDKPNLPPILEEHDEHYVTMKYILSHNNIRVNDFNNNNNHNHTDMLNLSFDH